MATRFARYASVLLFICLVGGWAAVSAQAQQASLQGKVTDATDASIPGAKVTLIPARGKALTAETDALGMYHFPGIQPGAYRLQVSSVGFQPVEESKLAISSGENTHNFALTVFLTKQEVTVEAEQLDTVTVESSSNASQLVRVV